MNKIFLLLFSVFSSLQAGTLWQELSFYEVNPAESPIVIDGHADEAAWTKAPVHSAYYEYFKTNPNPSPLKTEFRILYDAKGLYLAVVNHGDSSKLRKFISAIDSPDLWTDDCGEFYFDPAADGIGYRRFVVNSIGCTSDMMRLDTAVTLEEWSGIGWIAKTSIEKDRWTMEAFFPWSDLGMRPVPGTVWGFLHARFSWPGKFIGAASSPNGNYMNTTAFTKLYFTDGKTRLLPEKIGGLLNKISAVPWLLQREDHVLFNNGSGVMTESLPVFLERAESEWKKQADAVRPLLENVKREQYRKEFDGLTAAPAGSIQGLPRFFRYGEKSGALRKLYWKIMLEQEFK